MADDNPDVADFLARERQDLAGIMDDELVNGGGEAVPSEEPVMNGFEDAGDGDFGAPVGGAEDVQPEPTPPPAAPRVEPEKIIRWREEQAQRLKQKDVEEEKEKEKLRAQAKKELEQWYAERDDQLEKLKKQNRLNEKETMNEMSEPPSTGKEWEKIVKLCEFNSKTAKCTKDTTRMRSLLLQMKSGDVQAQ